MRESDSELFEPMKLQARKPDGGDWINIFPAQLEWMAKNGFDVRAIEPISAPSAFTPAKENTA